MSIEIRETASKCLMKVSGMKPRMKPMGEVNCLSTSIMGNALVVENKTKFARHPPYTREETWVWG
jgi:hypothetical protein